MYHVCTFDNYFNFFFQTMTRRNDYNDDDDNQKLPKD